MLPNVHKLMLETSGDFCDTEGLMEISVPFSLWNSYSNFPIAQEYIRFVAAELMDVSKTRHESKYVRLMCNK